MLCRFPGIVRVFLTMVIRFLLTRTKITSKMLARTTSATTREDIMKTIPSNSLEIIVGGGWSTGVELGVTPPLFCVVVCIATSPWVPTWRSKHLKNQLYTNQ